MQRNYKRVFFKIFDLKSQSVLFYSSEILGLHIIHSIERVHFMACKRYLGVPSRTPNKMVYGDLGRYPLLLSHTFVILHTGFAYCIWNRSDYLIRPTGCLLILMKTGKSVGQRVLLCKIGFDFVWLQQAVGDVRSFLCLQAKIVRHVHPVVDC